MASMQCYKPAEKTSNQGHQQSSLGQKTGCAMAQETKSYSQTQYTNPGMAKTQVCYSLTQTQCQTKPMNQASNAKTCQGNTKRRGLFQKIKDRISGDSSSDSESDDEKCCNRKN